MAGRRSKYESCAKLHIKEISKWVASGATDAEIATAIGIATSTLCEYKKAHKEFSEAFARGRQSVVLDIKAALLKKALGFSYEEKKQYIKKNENGEPTTYTEIMTRYSPPSETAAAMLLRNYAPDWNDKDNISTIFRKQELELKKSIAQANNFDLTEEN